MKIDPTKYVRPGTAAAIAGAKRAFIVRLCREGRIRCFRVCNSWFVHIDDCTEYRRKAVVKLPPPPELKPPRKQAPVDPTLYVTMSTAAGLAGCARQHMNREVNANRVPGVWIDGQWIVLRWAAMALPVGTNNLERIHPLPRVFETPANQRQPRTNANLPKRRNRPKS